MPVLVNISLYQNLIGLKDKINNLVANFWPGISVPLNLTYGCDGLNGKESAYQCRRPGFYPWVGKISWRRKLQPTPVFLSGKFHGQRRLVYCSLWGHKGLDTTYWLNNDNNKWMWCMSNDYKFVVLFHKHCYTFLSYILSIFN